MTASDPNSSTKRIRNLPPVLREADESAAKPSVRVVSVSPDEPADAKRPAVKNVPPVIAETKPSPPTIHAPPEKATRDVFIAPRVVDQQSFDDLASTLRTLIDEANQTKASLATAVTRIGDGDAYASKASAHLQDRLRLSARMLKAFQSQIERAEQAVDRLTNQQDAMTEMLQRIEAAQQDEADRLETMARDFDAVLDERADAAAKRFDEALEKRQHQALVVGNRIDGVQQRLGDVTRSIQDAEAHLHAMRNADAKRREAFEHATTSAETVAHKCYEAQRTLTDHLSEIDARIEQQVKREQRSADEVSTLLRRHEQLAESMRQRLDSQYARIDPMFIEELSSLLDRLEPWRELIDLRSPLDPKTELPPQFSAVVERLRTHVNSDLTALATTMRSLADTISDQVDPPAAPVETPEPTTPSSDDEALIPEIMTNPIRPTLPHTGGDSEDGDGVTAPV